MLQLANVFRAISRQASALAKVVDAGGDPRQHLEIEHRGLSEELEAIQRLQAIQPHLLDLKPINGSKPRRIGKR